ncbi:hypothetical protein KQH89_17865, partial [Vibrio cholerae]|uniref:hypothetical protein n=1 Tax=Vibrio cholerae TaxID=666 RepID=UPI001C10C5B5
ESGAFAFLELDTEKSLQTDRFRIIYGSFRNLALIAVSVSASQSPQHDGKPSRLSACPYDPTGGSPRPGPDSPWQL